LCIAAIPLFEVLAEGESGHWSSFYGTKVLGRLGTGWSTVLLGNRCVLLGSPLIGLRREPGTGGFADGGGEYIQSGDTCVTLDEWSLSDSADLGQTSFPQSLLHLVCDLEYLAHRIPLRRAGVTPRQHE
jgi:hypothetical protein